MLVVFDLANPAFDDLIAAGKAHVAEPIVYPAGAIRAIFFDPGLDIILIRIELTASFSPLRLFKCERGLVDLLFHIITANIQLPCFSPLLQPCSVQGQDIQNVLLFSSSTVMQSEAVLTWILNKLRKDVKNYSHFDAKTQNQLVYAVQKTTRLLEYKSIEPVSDFFESDVVEAKIIEAVPVDLKMVH